MKSPAKDVVSAFKVIGIGSIEKKALNDRYWDERNKMLTLLGEDKLNERPLFYGTQNNETIMKLIEQEGFKKKFVNGYILGNGIYFARDASYCAEYLSFD